ncbi:MAG: hydroxylamine reductase [Bacteroidales bacterium]|nr:hydroxylamine reductase [Bacteroidales bacterium]
MENQMFCFQCQETSKGIGCTSRGVCGKDSGLSSLMDLLLYVTKGICVIRANFPVEELRDEDTRFIYSSLFKTITNANFDANDIKHQIAKGMDIKNELKARAKAMNVVLPNIDAVMWNGGVLEYEKKAKTLGVLVEKNIDIRSLSETIMYGIKGIAAYMYHAEVLGYRNKAVDRFVDEVMAALAMKNLSLQDLTDLLLETGRVGVEAMKLLDKANTDTYGNPEMTRVNIGVRKNPGILVTGHDLKDMEELLEQTKGKGVDIYTHGEMLPAAAYPFFKQYEHFVGNYGNAWWKQSEEFAMFKGPILFTTNCIVPPMENSTYRNRIYTTGAASLKNSVHIPDRKDGMPKDFSKIIEHAKHCAPPKEIENGNIVIGFGHRQLSMFFYKIMDAVDNGNIRQFVVMAGCDGRMKNREYYSDFAQLLPHDTIVLTAGCAKYRYNKLNLRSIDGMPRVIDAGQCNDTYSIILFLQRMKEAMNVEDINDLPVVYNIAWYEQKSVIVLLALLYMGVKNIKLGPTLPAFLSKNVLDLLQKNFNITTISNPKDDVEMCVNKVDEVLLQF